MNLRRINDEVFVVEEPIVRLGGEAVTFMKEQALRNPRGRARICAHKSDSELLHEMIIALSATSYIRPHKHVGKCESFHIIEGEVDIAVLDNEGSVIDVVELGAPGSGRNFYYRIPEHVFHTLLIRTEVLVVHEVTMGPFERERTVLADFAPAEDERDRVRQYLDYIRGEAARRLGR
jgi:cupin fold WbuC family metalloprotein